MGGGGKVKQMFELNSTARRVSTKPQFELLVVAAKKIDVGLNLLETLEQRTLAAAYVHVAEKGLHRFQIEWIVKV